MSEYRSAPGVSWTVESEGVLVAQPGSGAVLRLRYPEAAVWDWFSRGESWEDLIRKTGAVAKLEQAAAERLVRATVRAWLEAGLLVSEASGG